MILHCKDSLLNITTTTTTKHHNTNGCRLQASEPLVHGTGTHRLSDMVAQFGNLDKGPNMKIMGYKLQNSGTLDHGEQSAPRTALRATCPGELGWVFGKWSL
jgi:hypothetical protein